MSKKNRIVLGVVCAALIVGLIGGAAWWLISNAPMSEDEFDEQASEIVESLDRAIVDIGETVRTGGEAELAAEDLTTAAENLADAVDEGAEAAEDLRAPDSRNDSAEDLETALDEYGDVSDDLLDICDEADGPAELGDAIATYLDENAAKLRKADRVLRSLANDVDYERESEGLFAALSQASMPPQLTEEDLTSGELPQGHPSAGGDGSDTSPALTEEQLSGSLPSGHPAIGAQSSAPDPKGLIERFLSAQASGDWQTAWSILPESVRSKYGTLEAYSEQLKGYGDLSEYGIASTVTNGDSATVVSWTSVAGMKLSYEWKLRRDGSTWEATARSQTSVE